jgi:hypothetical protein
MMYEVEKSRPLPLMRGFGWMGEAVATFKEEPAQWSLLGGLMLGAILGAGFIPFVGAILSPIAGLFLGAGMAVNAHGQGLGMKPNPDRLFLPFQTHTNELAIAGLVQFGLNMAGEE